MTTRSATAPDDAPAATLAVETVPLSSLRAHPRNYRSHPDDQLLHLEQSLREHGWYRNVVAARDLTILAGHGIVEAAARLGWTDAPVRRMDLDPDEPRAIKILTADNELPRFAEVDDRLLSVLLRDVKDHDADGLLGTGYDEMMLANLVMVTRPRSEIADFDAAAQWVGMPEYDEGEDRPRLIVNFRTREDRQRLIDMLGLVPNRQRGGDSTWWPPKEQDDLTSLRFEGA